jgi:DNA-binding MarR family transcriptional regulator
VTNLERSGRLRRVTSAFNGRVQEMELTDEGRTLLALSRERTESIEARLLAGLSIEEERLIRRWLVEVATSEPAGITLAE